MVMHGCLVPTCQCQWLGLVSYLRLGPSWVSMESALKIPIGFIHPPSKILICHGQAFKVLGTSTFLA